MTDQPVKTLAEVIREHTLAVYTACDRNKAVNDDLMLREQAVIQTKGEGS